MSEDHMISRVEILIQQKKFAEAEKVLANLLTSDATNIHLLSLLAEVYLQQDQFDKANQLIDNAIGLSPDEPHLFYTKSRIAIHQDKMVVAENHINQAINLDPNDADYFAMQANIKLGLKKFEAALETADHALSIDAENLLALNTRSTALTKLNRSEESYATIEGALREDPNNAYTHANYGWTLLEKGNHKKALEHFKESLANDPTSEYAQAGMVEALKAANPIYRLFLKYAFFMSNLTAKYQWGVIIGFYVGFKVLKSIAKNNENLQPYLFPLIVLLALVAFSTWVISPIGNLFLRFNPYGKWLLDKKEKLSSNFVAVSFGAFVLGLLLYVVTGDQKMLAVAVFGFVMMLPLGTMFSAAKNKNTLLIYTICLAIVGILAIIKIFATGALFNSTAVIFMFGFIAYQWLANFMLIKDDNQ